MIKLKKLIVKEYLDIDGKEGEDYKIVKNDSRVFLVTPLMMIGIPTVCSRYFPYNPENRHTPESYLNAVKVGARENPEFVWDVCDYAHPFWDNDDEYEYDEDDETYGAGMFEIQLYFGKIKDAALLDLANDIFPDLDLSMFVFYVSKDGKLGLIDAVSQFDKKGNVEYDNQSEARKVAKLLGVSSLLVNNLGKKTAERQRNSNDTGVFEGPLLVIDVDNINTLNLKKMHTIKGNLRITFLKDNMLNLQKVTGTLICSETDITSLKGFPKEVGESVYISYNKLTSLKGSPKPGMNFYCNDNKLKSLEGGPDVCNGDYYCFNNQLTTLKGAPKIVNGLWSEEFIDLLPRQIHKIQHEHGAFDCSNNQLTSLRYGPKLVLKNHYICGDNQLTSLEGAPEKVSLDFRCHNNQLKSLQGAPKFVGRDFNCQYNPLESLEGCPKEVGRNFIHSSTFSEDEIRAVCNVKGKVENVGGYSAKNNPGGIQDKNKEFSVVDEPKGRTDFGYNQWKLGLRANPDIVKGDPRLNEYIFNKKFNLKEFFFNKKSH